MKKLTLLNIALFLTSFCFGQVTITKPDFEKLVDYANCKYVQSFIEKNDASKPYFNDFYLKKVKPSFDTVSIDNPLNYEQIKKLLMNNMPALALAERINKRKDKYFECQNNISLLESLITSDWNNVDLSKTATDIQNEISAKFDLDKENENEIDSNQPVQSTSQVEELQPQLKQLQDQYESPANDIKTEYQKSLRSLKISLYIGLGILLLLILAVFVLLIKFTSRNRIINYILNSQRVTEKFNLRGNIQTEPYKPTDADINLIVDRVLECMRLDESEVINKKETIREGDESLKKSYKYLKGQTGKIFSRAENSSENSFFRLFDENDDYAFFEFNGDEAEAIANRIFSADVCNIISGSYQDAHEVTTSKPGKVKRIGDQWEVVEPVQIKLA
jgi:hypothetical protein